MRATGLCPGYILSRRARLARAPGIFSFDVRDWLQLLYDSSEPHKETLPGRWHKLEEFQKLLVLRAIRPDKVVKRTDPILNIRQFVMDRLVGICNEPTQS
eukprot:407999-Prorocentrum_minimum.AAC.1